MASPPRTPRLALSRRRLVGGLAASLAASPAALAQWRRGEAQLHYDAPETPGELSLDLAPEGGCATEGEAAGTIRQTEGPYYSPDTPMRADFSADGAGTPLVLIGRVVSADCRPLPNAVLDFWHADDGGEYDNTGYRFRGHQFTDANGVFRLVTIRPAGYGYARAARPPHIHAKVQARGTALLTTQLYFPDVDNSQDRIFRDGLVMELDRTADGFAGRFDFVLPA